MTARAARRAIARDPVRTPPAGRTWTAVCAAVLVAAAIAVYSSSFSGVFVFDDLVSIVRNPNIRSLWPLTRSMTAPPEATVSGRPIASLTLAVNYAAAPADVRDALAPPAADAPAGVRDRFLRNVWGYHAVNLAIHTLAALALFGVVRRTLLAPRLVDRFGAHATPLALTIALVWLVHPLQTSTVTYVVERVESLMGLFYLLTLYCAIRASTPRGTGLEVRVWMLLAILCCALGMASKEVMVTAPLMVWLWDRVFGQAGSSAQARSRGPLYAGLAATWIILAALVWHETRAHSIGGGWTWWTYLTTQAAVVVHYLRLAIVPAPLVFDYHWPAARLAAVAPQATLLAVLLALTIAGLTRRSPAAFLGAWFFAILAPTSSILPIATEIATEHRMYLPLAAVIALVVLGVAWYAPLLVARVVPDGPSRRRVMTGAGLVAVVAVVASFGALTYARNRDYSSGERLWSDTVQKHPENPRARHNYGLELLDARRYQEAETHLRAAVAINPAYAEAHLALGLALCSQGKIDDGEAHLTRAVALGDYTDEYRQRAAATLRTACVQRSQHK